METIIKKSPEPIQNIREMKAYALAKKHPFGFCMVRLDKDKKSKLRWLKRFPGCEKKLFTDDKGTTRMLVLYNAEHIREEIDQHYRKIEELERKLIKAGEEVDF